MSIKITCLFKAYLFAFGRYPVWPEMFCKRTKLLIINLEPYPIKTLTHNVFLIVEYLNKTLSKFRSSKLFWATSFPKLRIFALSGHTGRDFRSVHNVIFISSKCVQSFDRCFFKLGSMLWSQFSAIFANFRRTGVDVMKHISGDFSHFSAENNKFILKINVIVHILQKM
jgi:hypothetical protein